MGAAPFSNMAVEHPHDDELPEIDDKAQFEPPFGLRCSIGEFKLVPFIDY